MLSVEIGISKAKPAARIDEIGRDSAVPSLRSDFSSESCLPVAVFAGRRLVARDVAHLQRNFRVGVCTKISHARFRRRIAGMACSAGCIRAAVAAVEKHRNPTPSDSA